jgi:UrcA family protein
MSNCKTIGATSSRLVALASAVCLLGTAQAPASDMANTQHSVTVNYRDLNLSTLDGATALYRRITGAARFACGEQGYGLFEQRHWRSCVQSAIAGAVATVNNPLLTTVHSRENPRTDVTAMLAR